MKSTSKTNMTKTTDKGLHPRSLHNSNYDFKALIKSQPSLEPFVSLNKYGNFSIDFSNAQAVLLLNKSLLSHFYKITQWDIPKNYLCPPIPGRADYIHYIADLLARSNEGKIPNGEKIKGLDIGMGANCIYPIVGSSVYDWSFVGADVDPVSVASAQAIIDNNSCLDKRVQSRLQNNPDHIFTGIIHKDDFFDFTLCNPPFHKSEEDASRGTQRKNRNLGKSSPKALNFGGQENELWYPGGEIAFITKMIKESKKYAQNCFWFSSLVSKKDNLDVIYKVLKQVNAFEVQTIEMRQGQKTSRFVTWTFLTKQMQQKWRKERWSILT